MKFIKLILLIIISQTALGAVKLPALIGNNMILQQQSKPVIWGWATAHAPITIVTSWNKKVYTTVTNTKGEWKTNIVTPAAGGPYTITISGDNSKQVLTNILIGEVWFCSGQSNMEMQLKGNSSPILNANEIILNANNPQLRLFTFKTAYSLTPLNDVKGEWAESTSETARNFSAIAYQFGEMMQKKLHVPVGLIVSSVGGTMIESWMSKSSLANYPEVKVPEAFADTVKQPWKQPTALFNGMIAPAMNYGIKGMIWYQGESNRQEPQLYAKLFPVMVADWRKQWNQGNFPFYFVQTAPGHSLMIVWLCALVKQAINVSAIISFFIIYYYNYNHPVIARSFYQRRGNPRQAEGLVSLTFEQETATLCNDGFFEVLFKYSSGF